MGADYWLQRWQDGRIGFHESGGSPRLAEHHKVLSESLRVLVPLCGKSVDLEWLVVHGYEVVGIELSELAARAFFAERNLEPERAEQGAFIRYQHGGVTILVGDFFDADSRELGSFDGVYDRAAMVALPEELRTRYAAHLQTLLAPKAKLLLVALHFDVPGGPPFSLSPREIERAYPSAKLTQLGSVDVRASLPAAIEAGASFVHEDVYCVEFSA
jgi:thiopurine S-methyltransferase